MNANRIRILKKSKDSYGPIIYWMQRDQRVNDNWALIYSFQCAIEQNKQLIVVFNVVTEFLSASLRQYYFMIEGLKEVEKKLTSLNIPFVILLGNPEENIPHFIESNKASMLISDFNPLKIIKSWKTKIISKINISFYEVDAHNIIPVWQASDKLEFAAYTIRPKINKLLPEYLDDFPPLQKLKFNNFIYKPIIWETLYKNLRIDTTIKPIEIKPGENAAQLLLKTFIENKLEKYSSDRNDPNKSGVSNLSPYLHFGQISAQRIALILSKFKNESTSVESFLEELIVRRELSDNFCFYSKDYDNFNGFHDWAKQTLNIHRNDKREYIYNLEQFEQAKTHDELWNSAQLEMVTTGKMHGYMRMYWAKKILEWTKSPEDALKIGIYLNDKYELDGRDPNGYVGLAWSIGGVHDRAWTERSVFGKIRYMNYNGCKRKFDVKSYINKFS